jgi:hypothetical protein
VGATRNHTTRQNNNDQLLESHKTNSSAALREWQRDFCPDRATERQTRPIKAIWAGPGQ